MDASPKLVVNLLAREGEYWTVVFGGRVSRIRDAKGLHYLTTSCGTQGRSSTPWPLSPPWIHRGPPGRGRMPQLES